MMNKKQKLFTRIKKMDYVELINLQFDLDFLLLSNDELNYALMQLTDKIISPEQFKVIAEYCLF